MHKRTALTIGGEGVRSEHHIRVPESLLVVATFHMGLQLHLLDELRQRHCRHSFLPPLCLCSDFQSLETNPCSSSLRRVMQFYMLCFADEEAYLGIPTCNLCDQTPQPVHKFLSPHSNTTPWHHKSLSFKGFGHSTKPLILFRDILVGYETHN